MSRQIKIAFRFMALSTLGLGVIFPLLVTGVGFFIPSPSPSILLKPIQDKDLFQGRPTLSEGFHSGASNLSLTNPKLWKQVEERRKKISSNTSDRPPHDLLFASASGYDPDISVESALYQVPRIAQARHIDEEILRRLIQEYAHPKLWGFIGSERVNVLELNESLVKLKISS